MEANTTGTERRAKYRFEMQRELRYKMTGEGIAPAAGNGRTINICSEGVAFAGDHRMHAGAFLELSISWPVLLDDSCPMRLIVFGRVLRASGNKAVCSIDKYEFRTAPRSFQPVPTVRADSMLQRWAESVRKGSMKEALVSA